MLTINRGPPRVVSSAPYCTPCTHHCVARFSSNTIVKFVDDTVVVGLISGNDEKAYLVEVSNLWCQSLMLNVTKTKELILDFRRTQQQQRTDTPLRINGTAVERVSNYRYLGVHIAEDLTWTTHIDTLVRKVKQCLYNLMQMRKFRASRRILQTFYASAVESILTGCITAWSATAPLRTGGLCRG